MIAVDTSTLRRFLEGQAGQDVEALIGALEQRQLALPPVVLTEILSDPQLKEDVTEVLSAVPLLTVTDGYWARAGQLRAALMRQRLKAKVADCLIAQVCIDHRAPLITHDRDFRHYERHGLVLA